VGVSPTIVDCKISDTTSSFSAGVYLEGGTPIIDSCEFENNNASNGSALMLSESDATILDCEFTSNTSGYGTVTAVAATVSVSGSIFRNNTVTDRGGALYILGDTVDNVATTRIVNSVFENNSAGDYGGAVYESSYSSLELRNSLFFDNTSGTGAALFRISSANAGTITNCTITENTATDTSSASTGGAIYNGTDYTMINSIVYGNTNGNVLDGASIAATVTYCNIEGAAPNTTTHIMNDAPEFNDAAEDDFSLASDSPCRDAGNNDAVPAEMTADLAGNDRIANGTVDLGAYERP
jgi:hypothetical protein